MWFEAGPFSACGDGGVPLYSNVVVALDSGTLNVLEAPSGSGKSTLLRQVVGLNAAAGAMRQLAGESFPESCLPRWRTHVTLLAQDAPMAPGTVRANLELGFALASGKGRRIDAQLRDELLDAIGLGALDLDRDASTLSGGERHRVALLRGLLWDPPVLVVDEPLSGIDQETADVCWRLLSEQARQADRAVLAVLHDAARGASADRILTLSGGRQ